MWWGAAEPVSISNLPRSRAMAPGTMRNLQFDNLICRGESGVFVHGSPGSPLEDITFSNVQIALERTTRWPCGFYDLRPNDYDLQVYRHKIAGVYAKSAQRLNLDDVSVTWASNLPDCYGSALQVEEVDRLALQRFLGHGAHPGDAAQTIDQASRRSMAAG